MIPLRTLRFGPKLTEKLLASGLDSLEALLRHYPVRYEVIQAIPFEQWQKGDRIAVEGQVIQPVRSNRVRGNLTVTRFALQTSYGLLNVSIFNRPWIANLNGIVTVFGRYDGDHTITANQYKGQPLNQLTGIHPVYRLGHGLTSADLQKAISTALQHVELAMIQPIPEPLTERYKLLPLTTALRWIHKPIDDQHLKQAVRTLKYEEFLRFQTKLQFDRHENLTAQSGIMKLFDRRSVEAWIPHLPFELTAAQRKVIDEVLNDLQSPRRMYRLIQGDVGSGKTVVAALAILATRLAHHQSAVLVPTEILAQQHLSTLRSYLPEDFKIELLTSSVPPKVRKQLLEDLANGTIDCLVGTHAIIQDDVVFRNCGMVVADEQHRFGVNQRRLLSAKGDRVDFLLMSATPIPRTMANVLFGDLDISTIDQYHASKARVITTLIPSLEILAMDAPIQKALADHQQVYVVCPAIETDEEGELTDVLTVHKTLSKRHPDLRIEMLHGKMPNETKEAVLKRFYDQTVRILVTTTVIEVGINVPTANVMIIHHADRFGLSQLHQLRGRIGRGQMEGQCYLLSDADNPESLARLQVVVESSDGFRIAEKDLELRGPGELFGLKQSGIPSFLIANVITDQKILMTALQDAIALVDHPEDPQNKVWIADCLVEHSTQLLD
jgi:ATP-dependent DNA helicase RecG